MNIDEILTEFGGVSEDTPQAPDCAWEEIPEEPRPDWKVRRADWLFTSRAVTGVAVVAGSILAAVAGLMDLRLTMGVCGGALSWVMFWTGAWLQFRFGKRGLLDF